MKKVFLLLMLASLAACGVKNDLVRPDGKSTSRNEKNPSSPPPGSNVPQR
jgi:predicted small lipoprotein YifL